MTAPTARARTVQCRDCGKVIPPGQVTRYAVSRGSTGYGSRIYGRRQRLELCPDCRANRERWDGRIRGTGGLITIAFVAYIALRAYGVV